jgi:N-acetylmuramoyl-L-alanine amidase
MSYETTLLWYARNSPRDFRNLRRVIDEEEALVLGKHEVAPAPGGPGAGGLFNRRVCLVIGHEPGGGAEGERKWNLKLAVRMVEILEAQGAEVFVYEHRSQAYSRRCAEMRSGVLKHFPGAEVVLLLHYNAVDYEEAHGHEFHYRESRGLASAMRDAWQLFAPWSRARRSNGIFENRSGRGSGMIKASPAPCCLCEPFFVSNPAERERFVDDVDGVARAYVEGLRRYFSGGC